MAGPSRTVLRGGSLVAVPFTFTGVILLAMCALSVTWVFATTPADATAGWITAAAFGFPGVALLVAARGCRVVVDGPDVTDQVAWFTVWSGPVAEVAGVRTRRGPWRSFELETTTGHTRVLVGVGPAQFPANLTRDATERDLALIDKLGGDVRPLRS